MKTTLINVFKSALILAFIGALFLTVCCDSDQSDIPMPDPVSDTNNDTSNDNSTDSSVSSVDKKLFNQLKKAGDEFDKNEIWNGYNFSSVPMYFILRDTENKPTKGFLINPTKEIAGAKKITGDNAQGLNVYSYDKEIVKANDILKTGNDFYDFNFKIEGDDFYIQKYNDQEVNAIIDGTIHLATHEVFHLYQSQWSFVDGSLQDEANYPITKELIALQLLTSKIASKMPKETDGTLLKKYLEMYVAIRSQEINIDPSSQKLVKNMANAQEHAEGTAKYIETLVSYKVIPDFDSSFDNIKFTTFDDKTKVREYFAFSIWYDTGAAVAYMLANQGQKIEDATQAGKTLFDIADSFVSLSSAEKAQRLEDAKNEFNWSEIENEATRLIDLQ